MSDGRVLVAAATPRELDIAPTDWAGADRRIAGSGLLRDDAAGALGMVTGVGPAAAAMRVTAALERLEVESVLSIGVAGALPGSDLDVGDAVVGTEAVQADLGRREPTGFVPMDEIGLEAATTGPFPLADVDAAGERGGVASVAAASATDARAEGVAERTGAVAETMETAAVARAGATYGVPVAAVAGIANRAATDRGFDAAAGIDALRAALDGSDLEVSP